MYNFSDILKSAALMAAVRLGNMLLRRHFPEAATSRILFVSTTGIGDTLWATPAVEALRKNDPQAYIGFLTNPVGAEILKGNPSIDRIFVFRRGAAGAGSLISLIRSLRREKFVKVFIFHASDRIVWPICSLTGASEITGFSGQSKDMDFILTKAIEADPLAHGVVNRFRMLESEGIRQGGEPLALYLTEKDEEAALNFMRSSGVKAGEPLLGLHPGAQKPFKCWPADNFIETGNILKDRYGFKIVVTGDSEDRALAEKVTAGIDGAISAAGRLSIRGTAALISRMKLFIANDTGPMHIAFALKTPVIALFSPTNPDLCGPYNCGAAVVIRRPLTCNPCQGKKCVNPLCLEQITPVEVGSAAIEILEARPGR